MNAEVLYLVVHKDIFKGSVQFARNDVLMWGK